MVLSLYRLKRGRIDATFKALRASLRRSSSFAKKAKIIKIFYFWEDRGNFYFWEALRGVLRPLKPQRGIQLPKNKKPICRVSDKEKRAKSN